MQNLVPTCATAVEQVFYRSEELMDALDQLYHELVFVERLYWKGTNPRAYDNATVT
jgi:hypothetical protein